MSMRMAKDLLKDNDAVANVTGHTRNEILPMRLEFALGCIEIAILKKSYQQEPHSTQHCDEM